jgi:hypothetical protein
MTKCVKGQIKCKLCLFCLWLEVMHTTKQLFGKAKLKNTDSPELADGSESENENMAAGEGGMATISSQQQLVQLLRDPQRVMKATLQIYKERYKEATDDAKELWKFVYWDAIRPIL